jgi:hypothetical protein
LGIGALRNLGIGLFADRVLPVGIPRLLLARRSRAPLNSLTTEKIDLAADDRPAFRLQKECHLCRFASFLGRKRSSFWEVNFLSHFCCQETRNVFS